AYAKVKNRLSTFACTSSIGPGATNMLTGAAVATVNRLPVLLLPGDIFARRNVAPVLQQIESSWSQDFSANDCFKPLSKYWDRINRPEQLITALPEVMRVLTSPAETGAVTLSLPQDVQAEAFDFPADLFEKRIWHIGRPRPDQTLIRVAAQWIKKSKNPVMIAGGGVIYSGASEILKEIVNRTGIPVTETFAGKGSLPFDHTGNLGAVGVTGTPGGIEIPAQADLVIGIGTRYSDFTTASKSLFQHPQVKFININITEFDAFKQAALPVVGDAKVTLEELADLLGDFQVDKSYQEKISALNKSWDNKVTEIYHLDHPAVSQGEIIGRVNESSDPKDIMICAAGSMPGDLHKLWRTRSTKNFHLEYGYSCMGYEIAGGLGAKMAAPNQEVYVMVGDGSYLMLAQEIVTSIQENFKLIIVLVDNRGFASIGGLSRSLGTEGFGTRYLYRESGDGTLAGDEIDEAQAESRQLPVDLAKNAESLGAIVLKAKSIKSFEEALDTARQTDRTTLIHVEADRYQGVDGYCWWEVPVAAVSDLPSVKEAFSNYEKNRQHQKYYLRPPIKPDDWAD
ncbi:MAG: 3D-(3,5/4)-trihydroxycyclohexane-1,2-dione acylhydrolase (decyclizing), partial [Saprospiraceae bacterium]|nr:3D-(3,5/4)-trihydroxycyclohexane-1,2-dione acylhydrolase (decyclizing) [Saprospiraceae bacterium]